VLHSVKAALLTHHSCAVGEGLAAVTAKGFISQTLQNEALNASMSIKRVHIVPAMWLCVTRLTAASCCGAARNI
jgi:hypothetical protein